MEEDVRYQREGGVGVDAVRIGSDRRWWPQLLLRQVTETHYTLPGDGYLVAGEEHFQLMTVSEFHQKFYVLHADWVQEAVRRFGRDPKLWRFKCPVCGHVATVADYVAAGAPEGSIGFSCIGRWTGDGCNYAGGGLFRINPVRVRMEDGHTTMVMDFGEEA